MKEGRKEGKCDGRSVGVGCWGKGRRMVKWKEGGKEGKMKGWKGR